MSVTIHINIPFELLNLWENISNSVMSSQRSKQTDSTSTGTGVN